MQRRLEPEWLDELPPADPDAVGSRRDLRRVHQWMGNVGFVARALKRIANGKANLRIIDLGAGDGTFMLGVARTLGGDLKNVTLTLVDRHALVSSENQSAFVSLDWRLEIVQADVFDWLATAQRGAVVTAALFFHHLSDERLVTLFQALARDANALIACEPRRSGLAFIASKLLGLIGCNRVSRHDGVASVRAGFRARELTSLWPKDGDWRLEENRAGLFSHIFVAQRSC